MGGYGSTRWGYHRAKETADNCYHVTVKHLKLAEAMADGRHATGVYSWGEKSSIGVYYYPKGSYIKFVYDATGGDGNNRHFDEIIRVSKSPLNLGGFQYFIHCPRCQARARTLYRPAHEARYLCRACHDLTYTSCQESHKDDRGYMVGFKMAITLLDKLEKTERKLWRKRYGSRAYNRIQAKLNRLNRQAAIFLTDRGHRLGLPKKLTTLLDNG